MLVAMWYYEVRNFVLINLAKKLSRSSNICKVCSKKVYCNVFTDHRVCMCVTDVQHMQACRCLVVDIDDIQEKSTDRITVVSPGRRQPIRASGCSVHSWREDECDSTGQRNGAGLSQAVLD